MSVEEQLILKWLAAVNLVAFFLMGEDKRRAKNGLWRIPERTLLLSALMGGAPGALAGMRIFRHKTRHLRFRYGLPALAVLQAVVLLWLSQQAA